MGNDVFFAHFVNHELAECIVRKYIVFKPPRPPQLAVNAPEKDKNEVSSLTKVL